jgi:NTE family protein
LAPGPDTVIQSALDRRNLPALFAALPLLRDLDADLLAEVTREVEWFSLPGGATLFAAGQPVDGLYVVVNGALGVYTTRPGGGAQLSGRIAAGETAGEAEVFSGKARAATVTALRDTEVARLSVRTFEMLIARNPASLRQIASVVIQRLETLQNSDLHAKPSPKTFVLVPHGPEVDGQRFASALVECLRGFGRVELVLGTTASEQTSHWFHRLERANDFVVYVADAEPTNWTKLCLRQADCMLLVARHETEPRPWRALAATADPAIAGRPAEIVLLGPRSGHSVVSRRWLTLHPHRRHHHVEDAADIARAARLVTGRALAVVLSGGGARGFAHIGVMRALQAANLPVDAIGATSIGAIIGAGWAAGWPYAEMLERVRRSFVDTNPLGDYTLPLMSLVSGRRVGARLRREFGDAHIEDLRLPYFCVSTNLTSGQIAVHRRGSVWFWLRASVAIPGVLPPVFTQGCVHVDGATINNLPVDVMRESLQGRVIAVDTAVDQTLETRAELTEVPPAWRLLAWLGRDRPRINIIQILLRSGMINSAATTIAQRELADLVLKPPLQRIDMLDWKAFDRAIEIGYRHTCETLERQSKENAALRSTEARRV